MLPKATPDCLVCFTFLVIVFLRLARKDEAVMACIGRQIRAAQAALGWSREDLPERTGIHAGTVCHWERAGDIPEHEGRAKAPERVVAALKAAGAEIVTDPRPGIFLRGKAA